jgi:hypothetical protein
MTHLEASQGQLSPKPRPRPGLPQPASPVR